MFDKALVILPYLSVVAEKTEHLTGILREMKCKVKGYMGDDDSGTPLSPRSSSYALFCVTTVSAVRTLQHPSHSVITVYACCVCLLCILLHSTQVDPGGSSQSVASQCKLASAFSTV